MEVRNQHDPNRGTSRLRERAAVAVGCGEGEGGGGTVGGLRRQMEISQCCTAKVLHSGVP
ncbi:hypothetical protein INR49_027159 [Caranx melampygus]|nr:hypothetical protein INR49_027159 [Caranx melampygus]